MNGPSFYPSLVLPGNLKIETRFRGHGNESRTDRIDRIRADSWWGGGASGHIVLSQVDDTFARESDDSELDVTDNDRAGSVEGTLGCFDSYQ